MMSSHPHEIYSARRLQAPIESVYWAFADPSLLKEWWGPNGFTNTIHVFELYPGGKWKLTMHGPEKGHYENESVFTTVEPFHLISWKRLTQPLFDMEVAFEKQGSHQTGISFRMMFKTEAECLKIKPFATIKNEENFDRLQILLDRLQTRQP